MKQTIRTAAALTVLAASGAMSGAASAELTGNVGVTSNYIWRGVTQSADEAAVSGGIDYSHGSGFYIGTWTSSLAQGVDGSTQYELDLYAGFGGEAGQVSYDLGVIHYMYPVDDQVEDDFTELYGSAGFGPVTAGVAYTVATEADVDDENDIYYSLAADFPAGDDLSVGVLAGRYDFDDEAAEDYSHVRLSLSKGDFTFAVDKASDYEEGTTAEEDPRVSVSWTHAIDL